MKKFLLLFFIAFLIHPVFSQKIYQASDKLYYDSLTNQLFTGDYIEKYPSGKTKIEMTFRNGNKDGIIKIYFENEQLNEIRSYKNGKMHGTWTSYNEKGIKIAEAGYSYNKKNGKWYIWDENGTLRYDMTYIEGDKIGNWRRYDETGTLISEINYSNFKY